MDKNYVAPKLEVIGSVHELTLVTKIIGGTLDGVFLKVGGKKIPLSHS